MTDSNTLARAPTPDPEAGADEPVLTAGTRPPAARMQPLFGRAREPVKRLVRSLSERSIGPYLMASAPVIAATVLLPAWMSWAMGAMSVLVLYRVAEQLDPALFEMTPTRGFLTCAMPLNVLMVAWFAAMAWVGKAHLVASLVFPYLALLALCVAPACRWKPARAARRVRLRISFGSVGVLALLCHGVVAMRQAGWA